jgi:hypothetical protein
LKAYFQQVFHNHLKPKCFKNPWQKKQRETSGKKTPKQLDDGISKPKKSFAAKRINLWEKEIRETAVGKTLQATSW